MGKAEDAQRQRQYGANERAKADRLTAGGFEELAKAYYEAADRHDEAAERLEADA